MYKHVLIATDGSELAQKAVEHGLALAGVLGAKVTALTVTEPWPVVEAGGVMQASPVAEYERAMTQEANRTLGVVSEWAGRLGVACTAVHLADRYPAEGIVETAEARGCDLIVMASHGRRGFARLVLGSQATRVLTHSAVPVLVCK
jgi:nucleotide-binding universal stress UspA family protein